MRFYDIDSGSILVDGRNISDITRKSLRLSYSMVLQDTWLFYGTIYENIAYGRPDATREEVIAAAKAARIHTYIESLPQGYDTLLIDDGTNISKGQKQLLTIARALLMQTPMLILGRSHLQRGHTDRAPDPGRHAGLDGRQDLLRGGPPALHHPECRLHPGGAGRKRGGAGHP